MSTILNHQPPGSPLFGLSNGSVWRSRHDAILHEPPPVANNNESPLDCDEDTPLFVPDWCLSCLTINKVCGDKVHGAQIAGCICGCTGPTAFRSVRPCTTLWFVLHGKAETT